MRGIRSSGSHRLSTGDYRFALNLVGELGEFSEDRSDQMLGHLLASLGPKLGAGALWWSVVGGPAPAAVTGVSRSLVHGLDETTLRRWEKGYLLEDKYRDQPMWKPLAAGAGQVRSARRQQLVSDRAWYRSPHVAEWNRGLGYDDVVVSAVPLGDGSEVWLAAMRPWNDGRYREGDRALLELVSGGLRGSFCRHLNPTRDAGGLRVEAIRSRLPARHQTIVAQLITGRSEKQIAAAVSLSARTAHKYIEQVYRAFGVSSRAELMALWIARRAGQ